MYVESWIVAVVLILVIYLLWRVATIKSGVKVLTDAIEEYTDKNMELRRELIGLLIVEDSRFLAKVSPKTKDKVLTEQANDIRAMFANSIASDRNINGHLIKDNTVEEYLRDAFEDHDIDYIESDIDTTNWSIKNAIEFKMKKYE